MKLNNKIYDILKWFTMIALPAITTFYGVVGTTCNIPYTETVLTIASAFDVMLGTMLGVSNRNYNKSEREYK